MNTKIDWHYHISGREIHQDLLNLHDYLNDMDEVYIMASYFPTTNSGISNYNLYHHLRKVEKVKLYLSLDFEHYFYQGYNEMVSLLIENRNKFIGIKIYTGYQNIDFESDQFKMVMELAKKYDLCVMFHTGYLNHSKELFDPMYLDKVIRENKNIKFILAHLGNPYLDKTAELINRYDNVYTDISGLIDSKKDIDIAISYVKRICSKIKKEKVLFGTDYPVQSYERTKVLAEVANATWEKIG